MNKLMSKMINSGAVTGASVMAQSSFFDKKEMVSTPLPILNIAFSGEVDGGFTSGVSLVCGEPGVFKTLLTLYCLKAYLEKYEDAIGIIYDTEYGITPDYLKSMGIDLSRVIHIPIEHVEQLKFDFVKKLDDISKGDRVFFMVDSIGQIPSKKEMEDAHDEKSVADMTRAKALRSLFRLITIQLVKKNLPCFMINHVYQSIGGMYPSVVIPGGTSVSYSSNNIFVITKSQEKDGTDLAGWQFTININKSRYVRAKSKFPFRVMFEQGIQKYSGLLDIAIDGNFVAKPKVGWYCMVDQDTGELGNKNFRAKDFETDELAGELIKTKKFKEYVHKNNTLNSVDSSDLEDHEEDDPAAED